MFSIILFIFCYLFSVGEHRLTAACVEPPLECPNINVTFWLYTKANENKPYQLLVNDPNSIKNAPWVDNAQIKILIHGYTGYKDFSPNTEIRPEYMKCCNYNIISLDYKPIVQEPCYIQAARNTELVGKCTAQLIDVLVQKYGFSLELFHIIGFSLGAQTAGHIGDYITSGKISRITGLDPALPLFVTNNVSRKLDKSDALFVDVLHTNCLARGKLEASGHVDFFANGCLKQPGCKHSKTESASSCSHARAPIYYAESINTEIGFYGTKCYSWFAYTIGWCEVFQPDDEVIFGEYVSRKYRGLYFFSTNASPNYARGPNGRPKSKRSASISSNYMIYNLLYILSVFFL